MMSFTPFISNDARYNKLCDRMKTHSQIDLRDYVLSLDGPTFDPPLGFNFHGQQTAMLIERLRHSPAFGLAKAPDVKRGFTSFREISHDASIHLHIAHDGQRSIAHIDSMSIVQGRASDGSVIYVSGASKLIKHFCVDFLHLDVPDRDWASLPGEDGTRGGF